MTGESYWIASTEDPPYPVLERDLVAEVAVVGAGITGLTCALLLRQAGHDVVVVEATSVGGGVTGSTTGKVTAGQRLVYSTLERERGADVAARYAASQSAAVELVFTLADEHGIACDLERAANYVFAESEEEIEALESEVAAASRAGLRAELVVGLDVPFRALAAARLESQGRLHARAYVLGLARAFSELGGRIFQRSRVENLRAESRPARSVLELEAGTVSADHVVLATHVPITMKGSFFARVHPYAAYAVAAPVAEGTLDGMWINVGSPTRSLRTHPLGDGRELLIVVGEGHRVGQDDDPRDRYEALVTYVRSHFPGAEIAYRWSTQDQWPVDGLPYIGRLTGEEAIYVGTGFAGWGLSNGTLAGQLIADAIDGRRNEWARLFDPTRSAVLDSPGQLVRENLNVARELVGGKLRRRPRSLDAVAPGTGEVVVLDGQKAAVHRAEDGSVTAVSAACTHMGCDVVWNSAERTWDCPCHGSRFELDGAVLEGPALHPLEPIDIGVVAGGR